MQTDLDHIINEFKNLTYESKLHFLEKIIPLLNSGDGGKRSLRELNGLGSHIWKKIVVEEYIDSERQWN